jgi:hypothetical protein
MCSNHAPSNRQFLELPCNLPTIGLQAAGTFWNYAATCLQLVSNLPLAAVLSVSSVLSA